MNFKFPKVKDGMITSMQYTPVGTVKSITLECYKDEVDLSGVELDNTAVVTLNRVIKWSDEHA